MSARFINVRLGQSDVRVPIHVDEATTKAIAAEVSERIEGVAAEFNRIDTLGYFQRAVFDLACELHDLKAEMAREERDMNRALARLETRLQDLLTEFSHPQRRP